MNPSGILKLDENEKGEVVGSNLFCLVWQELGGGVRLTYTRVDGKLVCGDWLWY